MLPLNFGAPTGNPVYTKQELNSFLPNPNVTGLLGPALNFNAPNNAINQQYSLPTYTPKPFDSSNYYMTADGNGLYAGRFFKDAYQQDPNPLFRLFSLLPNDMVWNKTG